MFKNKIFLVIAAVFFCSVLKAQTIVIDDARFNLPAGFSYAAGGSITVPVTLNGCFKYDKTLANTNKFKWELCNAAGTVITGANAAGGQVAVHYATFINAVLPAALPSGNYRIKLSSIMTIGSTGDTSNVFAVTTGTTVNARAVPANPNRILLDEYYYGRCDGSYVTSFVLNDSSALGNTVPDTLELVDNYRVQNAPQKFTANPNGAFNLIFNPTRVGGNPTNPFRDAYYTGFVKSMSGSVVSTKAYHIINSRWAIKVFDPKADAVVKSTCKKDTISLNVIIDTTQLDDLKQNFPGSIISINWDEGFGSEEFTVCQLIASNGVIKHFYGLTPCERFNKSKSNYEVKPIINNPFNIINGPGITGTCASTPSSSINIKMLAPPKAKITMDSVVCGNGLDSILAINNSDKGFAYSATNVSGGSGTCSDSINTTWRLDSVLKYQTPYGKVEIPRNLTLKFTSADIGYHFVKLTVTNQFGDDASCPESDTTVRICVDTGIITPIFKMDTSTNGTLINDTIIACSPKIKLVNQTRRTHCIDSTHLNYIWRVHNAAKPFNANDTIALISGPGGTYKFDIGNSRTMIPTISIFKTGKYWISLRVRGKCDTSAAVYKFVEVNGESDVQFKFDSVYNCGSPSPMVVHYDPLIMNTGLQGTLGSLFTTIDTNKVNYTFQASQAGSLSYVWTISPGVPGNHWEFIAPTNANSQYPSIRFLKKGIYTVTDTFKNSCATKYARQIINYNEPPAASTTSTAVDTLCFSSALPYNVNGFAVDLTKNDSLRISWVGPGTFNPASGIVNPNGSTIPVNLLTPTFTPSPGTLNPGCLNGCNINLTMEVRAASNRSCNVVTASRSLYITPSITSANQVKDICSCSPLNYVHPNPLNTPFRFNVVGTPINVTGIPTGSGSTYVTSIPDAMCLINPSQVGEVKFQIFPKLGNCDGSAYELTVNVNPIPNTPTINRVYPSTAPFSMCSGEAVKIDLVGTNSSDVFIWTATSSTGSSTGYSNGTNQAIFNPQTIQSLTQDTVTYVFSTVSQFTCQSTKDSAKVIITPGPPIALVTKTQGTGLTRHVYCDSACLILRGNAPSGLGQAKWERVLGGAATITYLTADQSIAQVCGMDKGIDYIFEYTIQPTLAGCRTTQDSIKIYVVDTVSGVSGLRDTVICDIGNFGGSYPISGTLSRPQVPGELYLWELKPINPIVSSSTFSPVNGLSTTYIYKDPGTEMLILKITNYVCPDKADTAYIYKFKPPLGVNKLNLTPQQGGDRYCQGSNVDVSAVISSVTEDMKSWFYEDYPSFTNRVTINTNSNPITILSVQDSIVVTGVVQSKGRSLGCMDTAITSRVIIFVDSPSLKGMLTSNDTIVCKSGDRSLITLSGYRGDRITWQSSTTSATSGFGALTGIPFGTTTINPTIQTTMWFRAVVQNGNCSADTTVPIRIFIPTASGNAVILQNDTAICGGTTITLLGNTPAGGVGFWNAIQGFNNAGFTPPGVNFYPDTYETSTNPVQANITTPGVYKFVWTIKNFSCPGTKATITVINTTQISNNTITLAIANTDSVCKGSFVTINGSVPSGGGYHPNTTISNIVYTWEKNNGSGWVTAGTNASSTLFQADVTTKFRRYLKSDSCKSYSNEIEILVHQPITNNTLTVPSPVCTGTVASIITGSVPAGGTGIYTYAWDTASIANAIAGLWTTVNSNTQDFNPGAVLFDSLKVRRIVYSGKCSSISDTVIYAILPDAKANFSALRYTECPPFTVSNFVTNVTKPNTSYDWYAITNAGVRTLIGTSTTSTMPAYTMPTGPDTIIIRVVANSTTIPSCNSDSMSHTFYTSAKPIADFTINQDTGCARSTPFKTNFVFTNTTIRKGLFTYQWLLDGNNGNPTQTDLPVGGYDYLGSNTGKDTFYNITLQAFSPVSCASSSITKTIKVRTKPNVIHQAVPNYQCSGGIVKFYDRSVASDNSTTSWNYGDGSLMSNDKDSSQHIFNVAALTTFKVCLHKGNECAVDSFCAPVTIAANTVTLNITVNAADNYTCSPRKVKFYTNSNGGTQYIWNFGDGNQAGPFTNGIDSIEHTYTTHGKFIVTLTGSTTCGTVVKSDSVFLYETPKSNFTIAPSNTICKGDTAFLNNLTSNFTFKTWDYGNGTGSLDYRTYATSGTYSIKLMSKLTHNLPLGGTLTCSDTSLAQTITVKDTMPGKFTITTVGTSCLPYVADFVNTTSIPTKPYTTNWFVKPAIVFPASLDSVRVNIPILGQYTTTMVVNNPITGCTYIDSSTFLVAGPTGSWQHDTGYIQCGAKPVNFTVYGNTQTDSVIVDYGDGTIERRLYNAASSSFPHIYAAGGTYYPNATLKSINGCTYFLNSYGPIRIDYVKAYFKVDSVQNCGNTQIRLTNLSTMDQTPAAQQSEWTVNGVTGRTRDTIATFLATTANVTIKLITTSISGCPATFDTVINVKVNSVPRILSDNRRDTACQADTINYFVTAATPLPGEDPIVRYVFNFANGQQQSGTSTSASTAFAVANTYNTDNIVVSTNYCSSTYVIPRNLVIHPAANVGINPNTPQTICYGVDTITLTASPGFSSYTWTPNFGIIGPRNGASVKVSPTAPVEYVVTVTNGFGCSAKSKVPVSVIEPYSITITATPNDTICKGTEVELKAVSSDGKLRPFKWSPATYVLDTLYGPIIHVKPLTNVEYIVEDTSSTCPAPGGGTIKGYMPIAVGDSFKITFAASNIVLQSGQPYTLTPSFGNDSMASFLWTPNVYFTQAMGSTTQNPEIKPTDNVCYALEATSIYGCKDVETICVKTFCEASQVYIPNTFTPDGNGQNDYFYVTATGISKVVSFRVFNRWGQVVFERAGYLPAQYKSTTFNSNVAWDGKIKGVTAPTDTYVYTCDVECGNGTRYTYTGSVSLIK